MELADAVKHIGSAMDAGKDTQTLQGLANLGNYLWFRLQQKNCNALKAAGETEVAGAEKKHEQECERYKRLLPTEWQW